MRRALQHQQIVLKFLGYYDGRCDGIWGPDSVAAMRRFELSGKFNPGCPKNGQPINNYRKLPAGLYVYDRRNNYISHVDMPDGYIKKLLAEFVVYNEKCDPLTCSEGNSNSAVYDPLLSATIASNEPTVEPTVEPKEEAQPEKSTQTASADSTKQGDTVTLTPKDKDRHHNKQQWTKPR